MPVSSYAEFQLAAAQGWVEAFWTLTGGGEAERVLPDGCVDFIFDLDSGEASAVGTMSTSQIAIPELGSRHFGVRFCPGTAGALIEPAAHELTDGSARLEDVSRAASRYHLAERIAEAHTHAERARIVAAYLATGRGRLRARDARVLRVIEQLRAARSEQPIAALAADVGVSERQLERLFHAHVGARPKLLARVLRMQRALTALETEPATQAAHAQATRFADEAHLVREFRALTGLTPRGLLAERRLGSARD